ncbi:hypothetical protein BH09PAT2_BH09PAT2_10980 [soil metagenome]
MNNYGNKLKNMISVILIVKNDRKIEKTLAALEKVQKPQKTEIIVVDASEGQLNGIKNKHTDINWITFENKNKKKTTIPDQRNAGIKAARGNIIVFIDSDCKPEKDWLLEITKYIIDGSENIVAGRVVVDDKNSPHEIETEKNLHETYIGECPTMNVAYSIDLFKTIGLFDENFRYGSDVDISWRAIQAGYKIRFNPEAIIYHDLGDNKNNLRRMYDYGKARVDLYKKHSYRWKTFIGNEMLTILYPLFFILLPVTLFFPFYPLLILIPILRYWKRKPLQQLPLRTMYGLGILKQMIDII